MSGPDDMDPVDTLLADTLAILDELLPVSRRELGELESLAGHTGETLPTELMECGIIFDTAFRATEAAELGPEMARAALQIARLQAELHHERAQLAELRWQSFLWGDGPLPE